jgi:hypothetical protein
MTFRRSFSRSVPDCASSLKQIGPSYAIATVAVILIIVVIIAAAGAGAYLIVMNGGSSTTSPSTNSSGSTSSVPSSSSSSSSSYSQLSSSSTTSGSSFYLSNIITSFKDLIGNFSQMTVEYESSAGNLTLSYKVLGTYMINSTQLTETNFTAINTSENSSALLWFNPLGNITMVTYQGVNYTGSAIISASAVYVSAFLSMVDSAQTYLSDFSQANLVGSGIQTFGATELQVWSYTWTFGSVSYNFHVGNLQGTQIYLITYYQLSAAGSTDTFQLISLTKA